MIPPTPWDMAWIGPLSRTKNDLEQAVAKLHQPGTRVAERLLWFGVSDPSSQSELRAATVSTLDNVASRIATHSDAAAQHSAALADLHGCWLADPDITDVLRWWRVLGRFGELARSEQALNWLMEVERSGDFEKRAAPEEIAGALAALPHAVAAAMAQRANDALDRNDLPACARIIDVLRGSDVGAAVAAQFTSRIHDRAEDALAAHVQDFYERLKSLRCDRDRFMKNIGENLRVATWAAEVYNDRIAPQLSQLEPLCANDADRINRCRGMCGAALFRLGHAWIWSGEYETADRTFEAALSLVYGTPLAREIENDRAENAERAQRMRKVMGSAADWHAGGVRPQATAPSQTYAKSYENAFRATSGGSFRPGARRRSFWQLPWYHYIFIAVGLFFGIGLLTALYYDANPDTSNNRPNTGSHRPAIDRTRNYTFPAPPVYIPPPPMARPNFPQVQQPILTPSVEEILRDIRSQNPTLGRPGPTAPPGTGGAPSGSSTGGKH